ncbi:Mmp37-domain-containing protein [Rozella allomycis CSF55]|uniref:Phosphatidate cytidylyltransferase, mitochondrial n=1 Tax=Rozella allomycis (strain CSF55) TaxID=988480 RepID=A0A4P9Y931_ROZAC|nr:Mmp37-domain-containing protein [Rozella allomycis CSF55]
MFLAGRMHKPISIIKSNSDLNTLLSRNLEYAVYTSLLLLPKSFTLKDLYLTITSLSYIGDPRKDIAENPNKIANIVNHQFDCFNTMYSPVLEKLAIIEKGIVTRTIPFETIIENLSPHLKLKLNGNYSKPNVSILLDLDFVNLEFFLPYQIPF